MWASFLIHFLLCEIFNYRFVFRYLHPITYGDYPMNMRSLVGHRLPKFSPLESEMLKGSIDFLGINYYTSYYATTSTSAVNMMELSWSVDGRLNLTSKLEKHNLMSIAMILVLVLLHAVPLRNWTIFFVATAEKDGVNIGQPVISLSLAINI